MSVTAQVLINQAMEANGHLISGRTPGVSESTAALAVLNRLIDSWNIQRRFVMGLGSETVAVSSGTRASALTTRPAHIERAEFLITAGGVSGYAVPLRIVGADEYSAVPNQGDVTPFPKVLWCDYGATATVYLAPTPATGSVKVYTWIVLSSFALLSTSVTLLPGVQRALIQNLASELAPAYFPPPSPEVMALLTRNASEALGAMESLNLSHAGPKAAQ